MNPTKQQYGNYQNLYDYFNKKLFSNKLRNCLLNFSRANKKSLGHFSPDRWQGKEVVTHEINLNPATNNDRTPKDICSTLVHEMCHLWQQDFGKPSRSGYHNKEWGVKMKEVGLYPSNTGEVGGKETGQKMSHYIVDSGLYEIAFNQMPKGLLLPFTSLENPAKKKKAKKKNKVKYTCEDCATNIWGKPDLKIACYNCDENNPKLMVVAQ